MKREIILICFLAVAAALLVTFICLWMAPASGKADAAESMAVAETALPAPTPTPRHKYQLTPTSVPMPTPTPTPTPTPLPTENVIYLTFDDGPGPYTRELLDVLDRYDVKVTFFVVNTAYVDLVAEEAARGHSIGIHSASHRYNSIYESENAYFADLEEMSDIVFEKTGIRTELLRFPGGSSNTISDFNPGIMTRLTERVTERGYQYFDWNVLSGDAGETTETEQVVKNVIDGVQQHSQSIVLQHDIKDFSVAAVEDIIRWGQENGYTFLPLTKDSPAAHHNIFN